MQIEELSRNAGLKFLAAHHFGRMACVSDGQPYITPFNYVYHENHIYSFGTVGKKLTWLRVNPLACVEVDDIVSPSEWTSVIVSARYEELKDTPEGREHRQLAYELLQGRKFWWEPGFVKTIIQGIARPTEPVYFRFSIDEISIHQASPDHSAQ
jgi:uncharacterized protein